MSTNNTPDNEEEIVDVVNENDIVIGQMSKNEVHSGSKIYHREIGVLIYDTDGRVLLQQRSFKKNSFQGHGQLRQSAIPLLAKPRRKQPTWN